MARRAAVGPPPPPPPADRRHSAERACIFLCIRLDSGERTKKFRQCAPRTRAPSGPASRPSPQVAQVGGGAWGRLEGDQVAQPLVDGKQRDALSVTLGPERGVQPLTLEAGPQEVAIVHERVAYARLRQIRRQLGLPHPLREPQPGRLYAEPALDRLAHPVDLLDPVLPREGGQHGLVEP